MIKQRRHTHSARDVLFPALFLILTALAACGAFAELGGAMAASLQPRDAYPHGPVAYHKKGEWLAFNKPPGTAWWPLEDVPAGTYHVILTYSAIHATGRPAAVVSVGVGDQSHTVEIPGSGGLGLIRIATAKDVEVKPDDRRLTLAMKEGKPCPPPVLAVWRVDLVDAKEALPEAGEALAKQTPHGTYIQYVPYTAREPIRVLVSVHGTPGKDVDLIKAFSSNPSRVVQDYMSVAHGQGLILVMPVFDTPNFGGHAGPMGGYRGLFGRHIRADEFVNEILGGYKEKYPTYDGRLYLHGHSAGGQFANRYVIMNPDRIIGAVVSSSGTFAYPDPAKNWPAGMRPYRKKLYWRGDKEAKEVVIEPDPAGWLKAATLPIAVVAGELERKPAARPNPNQKGTNHVEYAENWVKDMNAHAQARGKESRIKLFIVKNCGHSGSKLAPTGFRYLFGDSAEEEVEGAEGGDAGP
jgi:hypothetical protein